MGIIIQARMSSKRLPKKVLMDVNGKPLIQHLLDRLKTLQEIQIVVATSLDVSDDVLADYCLEHKIECFRGDLNNVYLRYVDTIRFYKFEAFMRITGDSPLIDPVIVQEAFRLYSESPVDLVTNVFPRSFPKGQSVEIFNSEAFIKTYDLALCCNQLEHISTVFYENSQQFNIKNFKSGGQFQDLQMSVDTPEDLENFKRMLDIFESEGKYLDWKRLIHETFLT